MYANHEIKMPEKYRELTDDEMQYDGGLWNFAASIVSSVISFGLGIAAEVTGNKTLANASIAFGVASMVLSFGATGLVSRAAGKWAAKPIGNAITKTLNPTNAANYNVYGWASTAISAPTDLGGFALSLNSHFR